MPLSFTIFVLTTLFPLASINLETDQPRRLFLICPRCKGLFVFGDENSTITVFFFFLSCPKSLVAYISANSLSQKASENLRFKNPFTTLYDFISGQLVFSQLPISSAVASGDFLLTLKSGKVTRVKSPSNYFLVA